MPIASSERLFRRERIQLLCALALLNATSSAFRNVWCFVKSSFTDEPSRVVLEPEQAGIDLGGPQPVCDCLVQLPSTGQGQSREIVVGLGIVRFDLQRAFLETRSLIKSFPFRINELPRLLWMLGIIWIGDFKAFFPPTLVLARAALSVLSGWSGGPVP